MRDPLGFAASGLLESPLLADRRRPFLQSLLRQRAACRGIGALLSSPIELHEHQIDIARRVLDDPVQRYLLADEVGLGKTIEAGLVIRQLLLDHPSLRVQLILPPFLLLQWQHELRNKVLTHEFRDAQFRWARSDDPGSWEPADLLVVDEAHRLCGHHGSPEPDLRVLYEKLRDVALSSERLLLLSATPVLHNEVAALAMFHLLDSDSFSLDGVDRLRERVRVRAEVGRLLLGLRSNVPHVLLDRRLRELRELFPKDEELHKLADLAFSGSSNGDASGVENAITKMRIHISEVYRLNRRMLRTRRTEALHQTYRLAGRTLPEVRTMPGDWLEEIDAALETWRQSRLAEVEDDDEGIHSAANDLAEAIAVRCDVNALVEWAQRRVEDARSDGDRRAAETLLRIGQRLGDGKDLAWGLADELSYEFSDRDRVVIFAPTHQFASHLINALADLLGEKAVEAHIATSDPVEAETAIESLQDRDSSTRILVCDESAQEGRNLQAADVLVHIGLPRGPNALEQRIGRLDRWALSGRTGWRSIIVDNADDGTIAGAWRRVIAEGFGLFESSIASLQHVVEEESTAVWRQLFMSGPDAVDQLSASIRSRLDEELQRIREQDALDAIGSEADDNVLFDAVKETDADEATFAQVADELLASDGAGNLRFTRVGSPVGGLGEYRFRSSRPRESDLFPLIPTWRLIRDFLHLDGHTGTFNRDTAVRAGEVHLYRFGDRFIDSIADFLWNDDRGRAWGMWRHVPSWNEPERPWFRADFHVEATTELLVERIMDLDLGADYQAVVRRADGLLPPLVLSVWLDAEGHVPPPKVLEVLEAPYDKWRDQEGRDYSLNRKRLSWVYPVFPREAWSETWSAVVERGLDMLRSSSPYAEALAGALKRAQLVLPSRVQQMNLRLQASPLEERSELEQHVEQEIRINDALLEAVQEPAVRLDSVGLVVVSSEGPESVHA